MESLCRQAWFESDSVVAGYATASGALFNAPTFLAPDADGCGVLAAEATFAQRGRGRVVVRCVTDQGVASGAAMDVAIP